MSDTPEINTDLTSSGDVEVSRWLEEKGFGQYAAAFVENGITMAFLVRLTEEDLEDLGIKKLVHRANLLSEIRKLAAGPLEIPENIPVTVTPESGNISPSNPGQAPTHFPGLNAIPLKPVSVRITRIPTAPPAAAATPPRKGGYWARFGGKFLIVSILAHLLFAVGAAYYVVQTIYGKHKLTFHAGPPSPNPSQRAIEHKVQMAKKQNTMSAPALSKRIVTTGFAKVALPEMPSMPSTPTTTSTTMSGMGVAGLGPSLGVMGAGGSSGGGGGPTLFGFHNKMENALEGTFYNLKEKSDGTQTGYDQTKFYAEVGRFINQNSNMDVLEKYRKSQNKLYATHIFSPGIQSPEAPKAFGQPPMESPELWVIDYRGKVSPPESGTYHFVGSADAVIYVKLDGKVVLNGSWANLQGTPSSWRLNGSYHYAGSVPWGFAKGGAIEVQAGQFYDIEVLIGDQGGSTFAALLIEKEGVTYEKDPLGNPILPVFKLSSDPLPALKPGEQYPAPYQENAPVWKCRASGVSLFQ